MTTHTTGPPRTLEDYISERSNGELIRLIHHPLFTTVGDIVHAMVEDLIEKDEAFRWENNRKLSTSLVYFSRITQHVVNALGDDGAITALAAFWIEKERFPLMWKDLSAEERALAEALYAERFDGTSFADANDPFLPLDDNDVPPTLGFVTHWLRHKGKLPDWLPAP